MAGDLRRGSGGLWLAVVALGGLLLSSCTLPGTQAAPDGTHATAGKPAVAGPPTLVVTPTNQTQGVGLDSPIEVTTSSGTINSVTVTEAGVAASPSGELSPDGREWRMTDALDPGAHYTVVAAASSTAGSTAIARSSFTTLVASSRLTTSMTPSDGAAVGVGEPIDLRFSTPIPADRRAALLQRVVITSTPAVEGAWHWFSSTSVHFRTQNYWPAGSHVTVTANLKGFDAGGGVWGLGDWSASFTVGDKHVTLVDDATHQMQVYNNDQLIHTFPVSMGKKGFATIEGTLLVLYKQYAVFMSSCATFQGAACQPGNANYYADYVYDDTAISTTGYFIHAAPWSVYAQGHYDVSHGCINISTANAVTFYAYSIPGDVVVVKNTGYSATADDGEGDWQIDFSQFSNTDGLGPVWTGASRGSSLIGREF